jgi:hypothetical protein
MSSFQVFDSPILNPDNDLFGMVAYAEKLAGYIENVNPPFTIGIYGEWGDGKTSFVRLLEHYLQGRGKPGEVKFITFSAWPHTTSDALWRALIIKIVKDLYEVPETVTVPQAPADNASPDGFGARLSAFLISDALVLRRPPPVPDPLEEYNNLISRLDRTAYGSISKNTEQQLQVKHEVALMSVVKAGVAALGTVSPLVAGIRSLLGLDSKIDLSELLHVEKNSATRDIIESVDEFKKVFLDVFKKKAEGKRVLVFIDDLDRCLPDIALDVLEAIKIFLEKAPCIFIVAADEKLIGQGLKLRYKELLESNNNSEIQTLFAQKGQEYFEKIIQFSVSVPPRTAAQAHTFISAQFPKWTPATDIIQTAIGTNPRRLKQYCNQLSYKHSVREVQAEAKEDTDGSGAASTAR